MSLACETGSEQHHKTDTSVAVLHLRNDCNIVFTIRVHGALRRAPDLTGGPKGRYISSRKNKEFIFFTLIGRHLLRIAVNISELRYNQQKNVFSHFYFSTRP